ncbi:MAG TPA: rRNA maturation RNase YbeY, partial [Candidatus Paceibacterota bacterium]
SRAPFVEGALPFPFEKIARAVLGENYELSLVVCGDALARRMNKTYRLPALTRLRATRGQELRRASKKTYAPNVLSFPITKYAGEIFLNIRSAEREAELYHTSLRARLALLYIHGLFHLKGLDHGKKMERLEHATLKRFKLA